MSRIKTIFSSRPVTFLLVMIFATGMIAGCSGSSTPRHPGVTVDPTSGLTTSEAGGSATFTVVLDDQPTADVTIAVSSSDEGEGTPSPSTLTFTVDNWSVAQTVTVTGVDDDLADGPVMYTIELAAAQSDDDAYTGLDPDDVTVTNSDDDSPGITVDPTSGLVTTEAGGTDTFTIILNTEPTSNVTIALSSSNEQEGTVFPTSVTFTPLNWNAPQTITVTGVDDEIADGSKDYTIITAPAVTDDSEYGGMDAQDVAVSNTDNDSPGITVDPVDGLITSESGATDTFTIVLNTEPTADVTIALSSSDESEGTVSPASLTFTADNWASPQTLTVTGVDDSMADGDQVYSVVTAPASSSDAGYDGVDAQDVSVTNTDNDSPGITVDPVDGLLVTEAGGTDSFTVVLNTEPTADVTIAISSSDEGEGTVSPASLTFTADNWESPQVVTVTGVDDEIQDGNQLFSIITGASTSSDTGYDGMDAADVSVTNTDNDSAGITVDPVDGLVTTESGGTDTFTVVLNTEPTADVTIGLSSSDEGEGTVSPAALTFSAANWASPQTVTVTGVDDQVQDGAPVYMIVTAAATSADANYDGVNAEDVTVTNTDNDSAGITVDPVDGLVTTEAGGTDTFTIVLNTEPTADVTIGLSSSDEGEGTVSPALLTFTSANWASPQTVTVTGVDDLVEDGSPVYTIITAAAASTDANYDGMDAADVSVTNTDNDSAGITVNPESGLVTTEAGGSDTFTVVLNSQPTADVTIGLSSSDTAEGTVSPASLVFTSVNWAAPQTVTVTGVDDLVQDGAAVYTIITAVATSSDTNYDGVDAADVSVSNTDDDSAGITVNPTDGLVTTEAGGSDTFTVVLNSQPTADVTIGLSSSDTGEGTVSPASLVFTSVNWAAPQTVTVTGVDDLVQDGAPVYTIVTAAATSVDGNYDGMDAADVSLTNTDNDSAGITVNASAELRTTEWGVSDSFTVVLNSQPTADVDIAISSSDLSEGTVSPATLTFTALNWNAPQTITVTGVDDALEDGSQSYTIIVAPSVSGDSNYDGLDADDVAAINVDNDTPGILVTPTDGLVTTEAGGSDTFEIVLIGQPTDLVTIDLHSSNLGEGTVDPASVTFTSLNWNAPQIVTVTGVDDAVEDGDQPYTIITDPATSADGNYSGMNPSDVLVSNVDNDSAGITVSPVDGLVTSEGGVSATFSVVLNSQPTDDVIVPCHSDDPGEGAPNRSSVTFTPLNWNAPQIITVNGIDDEIADGSQLYHIVVEPAVSADVFYSGINPSDVEVTNTDNDSAGITVIPTEGLSTSEAGAFDFFTVVLNSEPVADVVIPISSNRPTEGFAEPASLTFTAANWNAPQTVKVTGVDDAVADGNQVYSINTEAGLSSDANYDGLDGPDVSAVNLDNDSAGIVVTPTAGLVTTEGGGTDTFTVFLASQPVADVSISFSSSNENEGTISPASLTFTSDNWNAPQNITVSGMDDVIIDGNQLYAIISDPAVSTDINYNNMNPEDVSVTNNDDDSAGFTVTPTSGLITTEGGGTAEFTIVLNTPPSDNVSIDLSSSNTSEGTVSPVTVSFTSLNWNAPQTVTITGVDDPVPVADGDQPYTIVTAAATSTDTDYNGLDPDDVGVTNVDNDSASVTVNPLFGLVTTEFGGSDTFTVNLNSQPTANVTITVASSDATEGVVVPNTLVFTPANWDALQTVTVTGLDDLVQDGNQFYTVLTSNTSSADLTYDGLSVDDVVVSNTDNDSAGITVNPTSGLRTTEDGGFDSFSVVLNSEPTDTVTIALSSSDTSEGVVSPTSLVFTPLNWNAPQTVTATGVDDAVADGNQLYNIVTADAVSNDLTYSGMPVDDVTGVLNIDNDSAGITVDPISGLTTTEAGGQASFSIRLNSQPTADVVIALSSDDNTEGTIDHSSLTFTATNWSSPQFVTITGADDNVEDGDQSYLIITDPANSADGNYDSMNPANVSVINVDDDSAGISVNPVTGLTTTEAGGQDSFSIVLNSQPTADVTIGLSSSDVSEGTASTGSLTFTSSNWSAPQFVTITGEDDNVQDGDQPYSIITTAASSADGNYDTMPVADVSVTNTDDDSAGITLAHVSDLTTTEAGGQDWFSIVLNSQPTADVTIDLQSSDTSEGTVSPVSVTFTTLNWNAPQTVTITGVDDLVQDGNDVYSIVTAAASSADGNYNGMPVDDVSVTNIDDDSAGITVDPISGLTTTEVGGQDTFTIVLNSEPTAGVTIDLSSSDTSEGTVSPASVTFTTINWNAPQTVTITGVDDAVEDGNQVYTIVTAAAVSTDSNYSGIDAQNVSVSNTDDDSAGITVDPISGLTTTEAGGQATFTIVLNSEPTAGVTIDLSSSDTSEGTVSPASVSFTTVNWNAPQTVTITGVDDAIADGDQVYSIVTAAAVSTDSNYSAMSSSDVSVTNTDNDSAGITVNPISGLTTTEAGAQASFTIVLNSEPTAGVTIDLSSSDTSEGTVSPGSVSFTTTNWNAPQTVTITGVDDAIADGDQVYSIVTATALSTDSNYSGMDASDVSVTNTDNDSAGITVDPVSGLTTTEAGGQATFTVVLNSQPTADVTIALSSSDVGEGTMSPVSLTFTSLNWNAPQDVVVTGVDDAVADGDQVYNIVTAAAVSTDSNYSGMNASNVSVSNTDDDSAGITVSPLSGLVTTEAGGTDTFTIVLNSQPTDTVTIGVSSSDTGEGTVSPSSVTFTTINWNAPQTVTLTGVDDAVADGDQVYSIITAAAVSVDTNYSGLDAANVSASNTDNDSPGITVSPVSGLHTSEAGGQDTFTIVLNSQPTADVSIALSSTDTSEGTVSPASVTFTSSNWDTPQTVTLTGVDDAIADGAQVYNITTAAASSADLGYDGLNPSDVSARNYDNDSPGITVDPTSGLITSEAGGTDTFTIVLNSQPTADVTISLSSDDLSEGTALPASVTFTSSNWSTPQTVTVTGVDDALVDGNQPYSIVTSAAVSSDSGYNGLNPADVTVTNMDNESRRVLLSPMTVSVDESGSTQTVSVVLGARPSSAVSISLSSSNEHEGVIEPAMVTFDSNNWNKPQLVYVTGVDDGIDDGDVEFVIVTSAAHSQDPVFSGLSVDDVAGVNRYVRLSRKPVADAMDHYSMSADGRYVVFASRASSLHVYGDDSVSDVFILDRRSGDVTLVSAGLSGEPADGDSYHPVISADGRYVAFQSMASNLVEGDTNGYQDVFVRDMNSTASIRVSLGLKGESNGSSSFASISDDGRFIAFQSDADNLVAMDSNSSTDVFVHDLQTGYTKLVSLGNTAEKANGRSTEPFITGDGNQVAFASSASNLVDGDTNEMQDVFVRDLIAHDTVRVSMGDGEIQADAYCFGASLSPDGRYVLFMSGADNLVVGDTNDQVDVFLRDRKTGSIQRVSLDSYGLEGDGSCLSASLSADGSKVVFASDSSNLVDDDSNGQVDVFLRDVQTAQTTRISEANNGEEADAPCLSPSISRDGSLVIFSSRASKLTSDDENKAEDIFFYLSR